MISIIKLNNLNTYNINLSVEFKNHVLYIHRLWCVCWSTTSGATISSADNFIHCM